MPTGRSRASAINSAVRRARCSGELTIAATAPKSTSGSQRRRLLLAQLRRAARRCCRRSAVRRSTRCHRGGRGSTGCRAPGRRPVRYPPLPRACRGGRRRRRSSSSPVHRLVGEPVGVRVLLARNPSKRDLGEPAAQSRPPGQRRMRGVLDLPAPGHLLDDELGVHPHRDPASAPSSAAAAQPGDQAAVLGDVVGRDADGLGRARRAPSPVSASRTTAP